MTGHWRYYATLTTSPPYFQSIRTRTCIAIRKPQFLCTIFKDTNIFTFQEAWSSCVITGALRPWLQVRHLSHQEVEQMFEGDEDELFEDDEIIGDEDRILLVGSPL